MTFVGFKQLHPPFVIGALVSDMALLLPTARKQEAPDGGLSKPRILEAMSPGLLALEFDVHLETPASTRHHGYGAIRVDALHQDTGLAATVHAGRAWTNHEALTALLAMAAGDAIRWGAVIVPGRYKGSRTAGNVATQFRMLSQYRGIVLDLDGMFVLDY